MEAISPLIGHYYARWFPTLGIDLRIEEDEPVFRLGQSGMSFALALIRETDTAVSWIERSNRAYYAMIIYKADGRLWKERLPGEGKDFGAFEFFSCKWIRDHLFIIYQGRWQDYHICSLKDFVLRYVRAEGERVLVLENELSYQNRDDYDHIRHLTVPELEFIGELTRDEATDITGGSVC